MGGNIGVFRGCKGGGRGGEGGALFGGGGGDAEDDRLEIDNGGDEAPDAKPVSDPSESEDRL
jgi:hypothetical protein